MVSHLRSSWRCWDVCLFLIVLSHISVIRLGAKIHEVGDVEIVLIIIRVIVVILIHAVHVAIGSNADKGVEGFRGTNALVAKVVVIAWRRAEYTGEHDVGVESIVENFVAVLAVGSVWLCNRIARAVVGSAASATVVTVDWNPRNHGWAWAVEGNGLGGPVGDSDSLGSILMDEDAAWRWDLSAYRTSATLKWLGSRSS